MSRCFDQKTLFLLTEGEAAEKEWDHLQSCRACANQYSELQRDLRLIRHTLEQEPPPLPLVAPKASTFLKSLPVAAGVLLALALVWGESRLWRSDPASESRLGNEMAQFLEQVSEAIFDNRSDREVGGALSDADLVSVQIALGESCSEDCRSLFNDASATGTMVKTETLERPVIAVKRRPVDPSLQRMVSSKAE